MVIARELSPPTPDDYRGAADPWGVDVGGHQSIFTTPYWRCGEADKAILLISAELEQIRSLSDRILVLYEVGLLPREGPKSLPSRS